MEQKSNKSCTELGYVSISAWVGAFMSVTIYCAMMELRQCCISKQECSQDLEQHFPEATSVLNSH